MATGCFEKVKRHNTYMCHAFQFWLDQPKVEEHLGVKLPSLFEPKSAIYPGQEFPVIIQKEQNLTAINASWGLIPSWAKDKAISRQTFNARAETIDVKPSFRSSFKSKRCLIPATGFYEWSKLENGKKTEVLFQLKSNELFMFAGLWDEWVDMSVNQTITTFTMITTEPNEFVAKIHNRMPVILHKDDEMKWLVKPDKDLLRPFESVDMVLATR